MNDQVIERLVRRTAFSYGQITDYIARAGAEVSDSVLIYNIMEASDMNLDIDILGAPQPVSEMFRGTRVC